MPDVHKARSKQQLLNSMSVPVVASSWTPVLALHASRAPGKAHLSAWLLWR